MNAPNNGIHIFAAYTSVFSQLLRYHTLMFLDFYNMSNYRQQQIHIILRIYDL
jgi:hypothetical protein